MDINIIYFLLNLNFVSALFLLRDDDFTERLPSEIKEAFVDDNDLCFEKMKKLKEMLQEHFPVCYMMALSVFTSLVSPRIILS